METYCVLCGENMIFQIAALQIQLLVRLPAYYASFCSRKKKKKNRKY